MGHPAGLRAGTRYAFSRNARIPAPFSPFQVLTGCAVPAEGYDQVVHVLAPIQVS